LNSRGSWRLAYPAMDDAGAADVALVAAATSARGAGDDATRSLGCRGDDGGRGRRETERRAHAAQAPEHPTARRSDVLPVPDVGDQSIGTIVVHEDSFHGVHRRGGIDLGVCLDVFLGCRRGSNPNDGPWGSGGRRGWIEAGARRRSRSTVRRCVRGRMSWPCLRGSSVRAWVVCEDGRGGLSKS
jgi:hypothetical protein